MLMDDSYRLIKATMAVPAPSTVNVHFILVTFIPSDLHTGTIFRLPSSDHSIEDSVSVPLSSAPGFSNGNGTQVCILIKNKSHIFVKV